MGRLELGGGLGLEVKMVGDDGLLVLVMVTGVRLWFAVVLVCRRLLEVVVC